MASQNIKILIKGGKLITLYDDEVARELQKDLKATAEIKRVSHVEPVPGERTNIEFTADLSPIQGPILTGFPTYKEAVNAEIEWIQKNYHTRKKPEKSNKPLEIHNQIA